MERKLWKAGWEYVRNLRQGGHGRTSVVIPKGGGAEHVLKELIRQDDDERRRRMAFEAAALKILGHPGIAALVDSNTDRFKEPVELYLVTEMIQGPDLNGFTGGHPVAVDAAVTIVLKLLDTLTFCHTTGVVHRDIKPDNIIMRGGQPGPVLIDFGLSFNEDARSDSFASDDQQAIGNRFVGLPELLVGAQDRHSVVSDLTQCVGVLFYLLTGHAPTTLKDGEDRLPHQRPASRSVLESLPPAVLRKVDRVFDRGFLYSPDDRWQSAAALRSAIAKIVEPGVEDEEFDYGEAMGELERRIRLSDALRVKQLGRQCAASMKAVSRSVAEEISARLQGIVTMAWGAVSPHHEERPPDGSSFIYFHISVSGAPIENPVVGLRAQQVNAEFVLSVGSGVPAPRAAHGADVRINQWRECLRFHLLEPNPLEKVKEAVQRVLIDAVRPAVDLATKSVERPSA